MTAMTLKKSRKFNFGSDFKQFLSSPLGWRFPILTFLFLKPSNTCRFPPFPKENKSTVIRRFGVGLVIDSTGGLVLTDRYTASRRRISSLIPGSVGPGGCFRLMAWQVPQPLVEVELTFGQTVTVNATCLFMHPHHNMASWLVKLRTGEEIWHKDCSYKALVIVTCFMSGFLRHFGNIYICVKVWKAAIETHHLVARFYCITIPWQWKARWLKTERNKETTWGQRSNHKNRFKISWFWGSK